jgi:hypothetical protein
MVTDGQVRVLRRKPLMEGKTREAAEKLESIRRRDKNTPSARLILFCGFFRPPGQFMRPEI